MAKRGPGVIRHGTIRQNAEHATGYKANAHRREHRLDQAIDTTRDDYDPARAARFLVRWIAAQ
jgi:hypothetical protein